MYSLPGLVDDEERQACVGDMDAGDCINCQGKYWSDGQCNSKYHYIQTNLLNSLYFRLKSIKKSMTIKLY